MTETILIDYLKGLLSHEQRDKVEDWYNQSADNKKKLEDLYFLLFVSDRLNTIEGIDENKAFTQFKEKLKQRAPIRKTSLLKRAMAIAAIFLGLFFMSSTITLFLLDRSPQQMTVATQLGERAKVTLPDGTTVWLNACSNIEYSKSLLSRKRNVALNGEGYFEVASKKRSPFVVSNKTSEIEVLGTKFNVKCNDDEDFIAASLLEGSILFSEQQDDLEVVLKPGEEILYDRLNNKYSVHPINSNEDITGWINGKIVFTNSTLEEIAKKLERHYNVKISFTDDMVKKERFNADFEASDNIYQIISLLEATKKFKYQLHTNDREIIISSTDKN